MAKRSKVVANLSSDVESIAIPRSGALWFRDSLVLPLRLRVTRRGRAWLYFGRVNGSPRRQLLGKFPRMGLDAARAAAMRLYDGGASVVPLTFSQLLAQYLASTEFLALAPRTQYGYKWVLEGKDYAHLSSMKLRDITRQDILAVKDAVAQSGRAYQNILRPVQALFTFGLDRGFLTTSPAVRLRLPNNESDPQPYTEPELSNMLEAARNAPEPWRTLYLLVAATGQRPSTWCHARWAEIDLKHAVFTVARSRGRKTKLGRGWSIPIARQPLEALQAMHKAQGRARNEWLFGRPLPVAQKVRDRIAKAAGMTSEGSRGTLHRFRSTMLSKLNEWGVDTETQQRLAGHASPLAGSRQHYIPPKPTQLMVDVAQRYATWLDVTHLLW